MLRVEIDEKNGMMCVPVMLWLTIKFEGLYDWRTKGDQPEAEEMVATRHRRNFIMIYTALRPITCIQ